MPDSSVWESLRENFAFEILRYSPDGSDLAILQCVNCDDHIYAQNIDQVVKWARRHLASCPGLVQESDPGEIGFADTSAEWYESKEILSDEED